MSVFRYILLFLALLILQVFALNDLLLHDYFIPFTYPLFLLWLPVNVPSWLSLLSAFVLGIIIDLSFGIAGFHAFATVFLAWILPYFYQINPVSGRDGTIDLPTINAMGVKGYLIHLLLGFSVHQTVLYLLVAFSTGLVVPTLLKAASGIITGIVLGLLLQYILIKPKR